MTQTAGLVYIVEDEQRIADLLRDYLAQSGFACRCHGEGSSAVEAIRADKPDLVLLDIMLPGKDGMTICRELRQFSNVPIIMLTARVEEIDRLLGLELGADDYICKPFSPREVVARVKALLRRNQMAQSDPAQSEGVIVDADKHAITLHGRRLDATAVEFKLFQLMFASPGRIFSRQNLMDSIYPDHRVVSARTIDSHIKKLRKKIKQALPGRELIHSVYGVGYKYERLD